MKLKLCTRLSGLIIVCAVALQGHALAAKRFSADRLSCNRRWELLPASKDDAGRRKAFVKAGELLGDWRIMLAGDWIDGKSLTIIGRSDAKEPLVRFVREYLGRPVDVEDYLYFLDDVLVAGQTGLRGKRVWLPSGRARSAGILVHPSDVFRKKPRLYGVRKRYVNIDKPKRPKDVPPAKDGELLGPNWTARFINPQNEREMLSALKQHSPRLDFAARIENLLRQMRAQGARAYIFSSVRSRRRGYLMWGSFMLSRSRSSEHAKTNVEKLERLNKEWKLNIPIVWRHPEGWAATIQAARQMSDTYDVVYATERGARYSNHYDSRAVDIAVFGLPRTVTLQAPDGAKKTFDLSHPDHTRDLNLSPAMIAWVARHFMLSKLHMDYPHWNDRAIPDRKKIKRQ